MGGAAFRSSFWAVVLCPSLNFGSVAWLPPPFGGAAFFSLRGAAVFLFLLGGAAVPPPFKYR